METKIGRTPRTKLKKRRQNQAIQNNDDGIELHFSIAVQFFIILFTYLELGGYGFSRETDDFDSRRRCLSPRTDAYIDCFRCMTSSHRNQSRTPNSTYWHWRFAVLVEIMKCSCGAASAKNNMFFILDLVIVFWISKNILHELWIELP